MAKEKDMENILISPVVVASSLGVVALGGKSNTATQVKTVLSGNKVKDENLHSSLAEILTEVSNSTARNVTWKISNRLYGPSSVNFVDEFHVEPLERVEKLLTRKQVETWLSKLEQKAVAVSLPKVSMEVSHNLSNVFHASALEWDTEGNPPDTSVFGSDKLKNPKLFYADHPFIFLVKDNKTKSILYIGRLVRPKGDKMRDEL